MLDNHITCYIIMGRCPLLCYGTLCAAEPSAWAFDIYIYIYMYTHIGVCTYTYVYICIYIYIYI